jgi:tRNA-dihydrouridine synthase B
MVEAIPSRPLLRGRVNFPVCMAPMVGLSHVFLRQAARAYLPTGAFTTWPTEMLNSRKLPHQSLGETPETLRSPEEDGLVPQILGNDEPNIRDSSIALEKWGAEGVDINMGCPVKKALRHNYGVALMGDMKYASEVVAMAKRSTQLPVSVKLRSGTTHDRSYLRDFVLGLESSGAEWITLHPRTASEGRKGEAQWEEIAYVRDLLKIAVVGNGDIQVWEDILKMRSETGCDSVMVGRAVTARPWILWQIGEELGFQAPAGREGESAPRSGAEEGAEYGRMLLKIIDHFSKSPFPDLALRQLRFFVRTGSVWLEFGNTLFGLVSKAKDFDEARSFVRDFFKVEQNMMERTTLRS